MAHTTAIIGGELPGATFLLFILTATLWTQTRTLPVQNVLAAAVITGLVGSAAQFALASIRVGEAGGMATLNLSHLPGWRDPLIWVMALLSSRAVAQFILRRVTAEKQRGLWLLGNTVLLTALLRAILRTDAEPGMLAGLLKGLVAALITTLAATPWLIRKSPSPTPVDVRPLLLWLLLAVFGLAGGAAAIP